MDHASAASVSRPAARTCVPFIACLVLASLLTGCADPPPALQVGQISFTTEQLRGLSDARLEELALISTLIDVRIEDEEDRIGAPVLDRARRASRVRALREEVLLEAAGLDDDDLRARYEEDPELELEVRHLVTLSERGRSEAHRREARDRAEAALERIRAGEPFPEVAGEVSDEPGAARRGGLLDPGREGTWVPEFWEAPRALEEGEVSGIVESEYGFHVLRLESRRELPFADARPRVVRDLAGEIDAASGWDGWAAEALADGTVDTSAVEALQLPSPDLLDTANEPSEPEGPGAVLARWPGGELTRADLIGHLEGGTREEWMAVGEGSMDERLERVRAVADTAHLDALARERGLEPLPADLTEVQRAWELRVTSWTSFLGIPDEIRRDEAAQLALDALRLSEQNASIARSELRQWSPALRNTVPVRREDADAP